METKFLHGIPLFEPLSEKEVSKVANRMEIRQIPKDSIVLNEGEESNSLYVILTGKVKVFLVDESGEEVTLNFLGEDDYFGEVSLFDNGVRSASVVTLKDSYFGVLEKEDFLELISEHPEIVQSIMMDATRRMRDLSNNVRSLAANW